MQAQASFRSHLPPSCALRPNRLPAQRGGKQPPPAALPLARSKKTSLCPSVWEGLVFSGPALFSRSVMPGALGAFLPQTARRQRPVPPPNGAGLPARRTAPPCCRRCIRSLWKTPARRALPPSFPKGQGRAPRCRPPPRTPPAPKPAVIQRLDQPAVKPIGGQALIKPAAGRGRARQAFCVLLRAQKRFAKPGVQKFQAGKQPQQGAQPFFLFPGARLLFCRIPGAGMLHGRGVFGVKSGLRPFPPGKQPAKPLL